MKRLLPIVLISLISSFSFSQDLNTTNADTHLSGVTGTSAAAELSSHIDVVNAGSEPFEIRCFREVLYKESADSDERFCWGGQCYANDTDSSWYSQIIPSGETAPSLTDSGFTGYYNYNDMDGVCQVRYCFREVGNESNETCIDVNYCVGSPGFCGTFLGTDEIIEETVLGQVSPNPANENFLVSYKLGSEVVNGEMIIMNALGEQVKNVQLSSRTGVINFDATDLQTGMYFYTLKNNGKTEGTKKFIVSH